LQSARRTVCGAVGVVSLDDRICRHPWRVRAFALAVPLAAFVAVAAVIGTRPARADDAQWEFAAAMSQRRSYIAATELRGEIYAAGGMVGETGRRLATFARYDPRTDSWTTLPRLPEAIRAAAAAALGHTIYVIGGDPEHGEGTEVYAYDTRARTWSRRAPLPEPRLNHAVVPLGGKLYVLGGYDSGRERRDVYVYDPASDRWSTSTPLPQPNHTFGAVIFGGEIWVIGGRRGERVLRSVWIYDPRTSRWRAGPTLPRPMELVGAAPWRDQIHAIWDSTYEIYDTSTGLWTEGPRSLVVRHGLKAFAIGNRLYAVGGCTTDLHDSQVVEVRQLS
jgi:Kelch motif